MERISDILIFILTQWLSSTVSMCSVITIKDHLPSSALVCDLKLSESSNCLQIRKLEKLNETDMNNGIWL